MASKSHFALVALIAAACAAAPAHAQDANIFFHPDSIERWLRDDSLEIVTAEDTRFEGDRTQRVTVRFPDGLGFLVKWAKAPAGGEEFNNVPRYELAAYRVQKLFLDPSDYVVPPTVIRAFDLDWYRTLERSPWATFEGVNSVVVVLQYWLRQVTFDDWWEEHRFENDRLYAYHLANMNILTYLIRHMDSNLGNFLVSEDSANPRVFSVDNGVAFESERSDRGTKWSRIQVDRLPRVTVERLRQITVDDLVQALGVMVQFEVRDRQLVRVEPTENLRPEAGIRRKDDVVQLGLTAWEIDKIHARLEELLERVDDGKYELFSAR